jgi:DNA-binding transcriptional MerR regulator
MENDEMPRNDHSLMKLTELAKRSGIPPRTIRLYITRGLLMGPRRRGRAAAYGPEHLERLREIRELQDQGRTLHEISQSLGQGDRTRALPVGEAWTGYQAAPDVVVLVRPGASPWRSRHIRMMVARMAAELATLRKGTEHGFRT